MTESKGQPRTYLDRERLLPNAEFVLISYAHASAEAVYPDLDALYAAGLNLWYDKELKSGEVWHETVRDRLSDPRCCGIIFFFDVNCLVNDSAGSDTTGRSAVEREIAIFEEIAARRPELRAFCVLAPEDGSVYSVVRSAFLKCAHLSPARLSEVLPEERVLTVLRAFNRDKIYVLRTGDYIADIVSAVAATNPLAVTDSRAAESEVTDAFGSLAKSVNGRREITLGSYPRSLATGATGGAEGEVTELHGERVMTRGRRQYLFEPLTWVLLETDGHTATLLSKELLDASFGTEASVREALDRLLHLGFTEEEREALVSLSLPSEDIVLRLGGTLPALSATELCERTLGEDAQIFAWLSDTEGGTRSTLCGVRDGTADTDYDFCDARYGVLPLIQVNIETIRRMYHG